MILSNTRNARDGSQRSVAFAALVHAAVMRSFAATSRGSFMDDVRSSRVRATTTFIHGINSSTHETVLSAVSDYLCSRMRDGVYTIVSAGDSIYQDGDKTVSSWPKGFSRVIDSAVLITI